jgi:glycosyltransferase involved in cell wall biosynthesis
MSKFIFTGRLTPADLGRLLATSDLHIYLTVPFVLSWSMMDALSCGAVVLASRTPPIEEMIRENENGLLADFFTPEDFAAKAVEVLKDPNAFRHLGQAGEKMIIERYSLEAVLPRMLKMYEDVMARRPPLVLEDQPSSAGDETITKAVKLKATRSPFHG